MHIDLHDIESITSNYTTLTSGTVVKTLRILDISGNKYTINLYSKKRKNLKAKKDGVQVDNVKMIVTDNNGVTWFDVGVEMYGLTSDNKLLDWDGKIIDIITKKHSEIINKLIIKKEVE